MTVQDPALARHLKDRLRALVKDRPWYRGIAIERRGGELVIRLNVSPSTDTRKFPQQFHGIPIEIVRIEGYAPRSV